MTLKEAERLFRSIRYYDRLSRTIEEKRQRLIYLIQEHNIRYLSGYEIEVQDGEIRYRKVPERGYRQLELEL